MALEQPTSLTATATTNYGVVLTWQDNSTEETNFQIERAVGAGSFSIISSVGASVTSYTDTGTSAGVTYNYRVKAINIFGFVADSPYSSTATITTIAALTTPTGVTLTELFGPSVIVEWDTYSDADATGIAVYRSETGVFYLVGTVATNLSNPSFTDGTVIAGKIYEYKIKAFNSFGFVDDSAFSDIVSITISGTVEPELIIPLGVVFYNTLQEYSLFDVEAVKPVAAETDLNASGDDWINVVRDIGVVGDGSDETALIQVALDMARDNVVAGIGKNKVLIPSQVQVSIGPVEDDLSNGLIFGAMGVCLWLDPGVTIRVDGTLRAAYDYTYAYANDNITIFENRNAFVGDLTDRDESIVIEGNGIIDLEGIYTSGTFTTDTTTTKETKNICALRAYKSDRMTVKDVTIKHGVFHKLINGFSNHLSISNVKFVDALKYESNDSPIRTDTALITLDVCNQVRVSGCVSDGCGVYKGIADWASKDVIASENTFSDLISGDGTLTVNAQGDGFWFTDYGMEYAELDMAFDEEIYVLADGFDARTTITNNVFCRNGAAGLSLNGASWDGKLTKGIFVLGNVICSNAEDGLFYCGLGEYLFAHNQIKNNGWGLPLEYD